MKILSLLLLAFVLFSCKNANKTDVPVSLGQVFKTDYIQGKIKEADEKYANQSFDMAFVKKIMADNAELGIAAVPVIEHVIGKNLNKLTKTQNDSVYLLFSSVLNNAINLLDDSLESHFGPVLRKIENNTEDQETSEFKKCLDLCGMSLLTTEGTFYIDAKYDYMYKLFKGHVSAALNDFLKIRSKELKEGFSEDAGLVISFKDLYERVVIWEDFMQKYPDFSMMPEVKGLYESYFSTFLTGMDNSRVFDTEEETLSPEIKSLYEEIIARADSKRSTKIISNYYDLLKVNNFKQPENMDKFLQDNGLGSMMGVQPETR